MESEAEKVLIVFEEHFSRGPAKSEWKFSPKPLMESEFVGGGTHKKYLAVVKKGTRATLIRFSNRGNLHIKEITIERNCFLDFLGDVHELPEKYLQYARMQGLIP